jgi:hypothetical protein
MARDELTDKAIRRRAAASDAGSESDDSDSSGAGPEVADLATAGGPRAEGRLRDVGIVDGLAGRADELAATLGDRVVADVPVAGERVVSEVVSEASSVTAAAEETAEGSTGWQEGSARDTGWLWSDAGAAPSSGSTSPGDSTYEDLSRDYLRQTGRYTDEQVDQMSSSEVADAMEDETLRAYMGYEGPVSGETAWGWAQAEAGHEEAQLRREYLISVGYDPDEVNAMDDQTLYATVEAEAAAVLAGGEGGIGEDTGKGGTSLSLADRESGRSGPAAEEPDSSAAGSGSGETSSSSDDGSDDDDDDEDDGDAPVATEDTGGSTEEEGNQGGSGAAPEASTPMPDQVDEDPAARAAFLASRAGREQRAMDEHAVGNARGGGLVDGDLEDPAARQAWLTSDLSAGERRLVEERAAMARGGGHTDPVDGEPVAEGQSEVDVTRLPGYGLVDPVDAGTTRGGSPTGPIPGAPGGLPVGPSVAGEDDPDLGALSGSDLAPGSIASADLVPRGLQGRAELLGDGLHADLDVDVDLDLDL